MVNVYNLKSAPFTLSLQVTLQFDDAAGVKVRNPFLKQLDFRA